MFGNWATGKVRMVREPTSTRTMDITMATMGRLMKNFDMGLFILCFGDKRLGGHMRALTYFLHAFSDNTFAWLQSLGDNPLAARLVSDFNRLNGHFVFAINDGDLVATLQLRHGTLRHK